MTIYPWQQEDWRAIQKLRTKNIFPHALLLSGINGLGKKQFALTLSYAMLCKHNNPEGFNCGTCHNCCLIQSHSYPDLCLVEPLENTNSIKIDEIRNLITFVTETPLCAEKRIVIINSAQAMNHHSANALLKTLEEPPPHTFFILITETANRLPLTIKSRCQKVILTKPSLDIGMQWLLTQKIDPSQAKLLLNLAQGAPLTALTIRNGNALVLRDLLINGLFDLLTKKLDPLVLAQQLQEYDLPLLIRLLRTLLLDFVKLRWLPESASVYEDYVSVMHRFSHRLTKSIFHYNDIVNEVYRLILDGINLNRLLVLETLLIEWVKHVPG